MTTWLKKIQANLAAVTPAEIDSMEPVYVGCSHDHVVGVANEDLRRLAFLVDQSRNRVAEQLKELESELFSDEEQMAIARKLERHKRVHATLEGMFWTSVREDFPELYGMENVGMRQGWKIVWCEHPGQHELLKTLMGFGFQVGSTETMSD